MSKDMKVKDLVCSLHIAPKLERKFNGDVEIAHSLPPGRPVDVYAVDEYHGCPANWMHGSDIVSSYFLEVIEGSGMWLNFNDCAHHTHDVAIVVSIQGVNPITGQKMVGEEKLRLEKYETKCPVHDVEFQQDRFCPECGYKWPAQNYISTTGTPWGSLWIDGFRNADGSVRQYIFTEEEMKGVASQKLGDERVFAIGIAFYLSKKKKPEPKLSYPIRGIEDTDLDYSYETTGTPWKSYQTTYSHLYKSCITSHLSLNLGAELNSSINDLECDYINDDGLNEVVAGCCSEELTSGIILPDSTKDVEYDRSLDSRYDKITSQSVAEEFVEPVKAVKKLEVGAGALINQKIHEDPKDIDFWEKKPVGMIYINYSDEESIKDIINRGKREEKKEGFLQDVELSN